MFALVCLSVSPGLGCLGSVRNAVPRSEGGHRIPLCGRGRASSSRLSAVQRTWTRRTANHQPTAEQHRGPLQLADPCGGVARPTDVRFRGAGPAGRLPHCAWTRACAPRRRVSLLHRVSRWWRSGGGPRLNAADHSGSLKGGSGDRHAGSRCEVRGAQIGSQRVSPQFGGDAVSVEAFHVCPRTRTVAGHVCTLFLLHVRIHFHLRLHQPTATSTSISSCPSSSIPTPTSTSTCAPPRTSTSASTSACTCDSPRSCTLTKRGRFG